MGDTAAAPVAILDCHCRWVCAGQCSLDGQLETWPSFLLLMLVSLFLCGGKWVYACLVPCCCVLMVNVGLGMRRWAELFQGSLLRK